jgi:hypothetical protein
MRGTMGFDLWPTFFIAQDESFSPTRGAHTKRNNTTRYKSRRRPVLNPCVFHISKAPDEIQMCWSEPLIFIYKLFFVVGACSGARFYTINCRCFPIPNTFIYKESDGN